jgi:hypothetical protein
MFRNIGRLNLAEFRPTIVQVTNCSFAVLNNLTHNLLRKSALKIVQYISCIRIIYNIEVMKCV